MFGPARTTNIRPGPYLWAKDGPCHCCCWVPHLPQQTKEFIFLKIFFFFLVPHLPQQTEAAGVPPRGQRSSQSPTKKGRNEIPQTEANGIQHNFNRRTGEAGEDWCRDFMARHSDEISLRTPESASAARARAFNQGAVNAFFDLLEMVQDGKKFTPDRVYNVDETGITTVPN
ncbi:hypothetical protein LSAT2_024277 [Lamellibrachia satsuma]|nr:hypothetical protein LSAT2_024277 [Lamellibrachia satsuma]